MIRVKMLSRNETCIIDDGKTYIFGLNGKCSKADAGGLSSYMKGALDLPVISLLSSNEVVDIGVNETGKGFRRFTTSLGSIECAFKLQMKGGFIKMLNRCGVVKDVPYNQLLFIYQEGYCLDDILKELEAKEAEKL